MRAIQVSTLVNSRQLHADPCFTFRNHRKGKTDDIDALGQQAGRHLLGQICLVEHYRDDGMFAWLDVEACRGHLLAKVSAVFHEPLAQFTGAGQHAEYRDAGGHQRGRQAVRE